LSPTRRCRLAWLTNVPSGDQIDLLRALAERPELDLTVIYCSALSVKGVIDCVEPRGRGRALKGRTLPGPGGRLFFNPSIVPHLLKTSYDLVIVGSYIHPTMQLAMLVRALQKRPWVLFGERPGLNNGSWWAKSLRRFPLMMVRTADAIIATGRLAQQQYETRFGSEFAVHSLPYLVCPEPFLQIERAAKRAPNGVCFLACGELIPRKGTDVLIKAFARAAHSLPNIYLKIVGDGPERNTLMGRVPQEIRNRVTFTGPVPFAERTKSFALSDVFVHPARHDGWGVVIQEALSAGLPVIATRQTGAAYDLVEEGKNGFLVEADDEDQLCERIVWFSEHQEQIPDFGAHARNRASSLTPEWGATRIVEIARGVLKKRGLAI
jgi:glycosyltransferase involved in cell wall biosynthesis